MLVYKQYMIPTVSSADLTEKNAKQNKHNPFYSRLDSLRSRNDKRSGCRKQYTVAQRQRKR